MTQGVKDAFSGSSSYTMEVDTTWASSRAANGYTGDTVSLAGLNRSFDTYTGAGPGPSQGGSRVVTATSGDDALLYDTTGSTKVDSLGHPVADAHHFATIEWFVMGLGNDVLDLTSAGGGAGSYDAGQGRIFGDTGNGVTLGGGAVGGDDVLWDGGGSTAFIFGDADIMSGAGGGNDALHGGGGSDGLFGDAQSLKNATAGDDLIDGGTGNDRLFGDGEIITGTLARGHNTFAFDGPGSGQDTIGGPLFGGTGANGFQHGLDHIRLDADYGYTAQQALDHTADVGGRAVVDLGNGDSIALFGVTTASLTADDFTIA